MALTNIANGRAERSAQAPMGILQHRKLMSTKTAVTDDDVLIETYRQPHNLELTKLWQRVKQACQDETFALNPLEYCKRDICGKGQFFLWTKLNNIHTACLTSEKDIVNVCSA